MNDYAAYLSCVFAAVNIQRQWKRYESPLYNLFQQIELPPLARADTELLARTPVRGRYDYDEDAIDLIYQLSKGRPMKIQLLCLEAINYIREQGRKNVTPKISSVSPTRSKDTTNGCRHAATQSLYRRRPGARPAFLWAHEALIQSILDGNDRAIWVVGNRRIGKTSLLRRMEQLGNFDGRVAFTDQHGGGRHRGRPGAVLHGRSSRPTIDRLARLGLKIGDLQGKTPQAIMRLLDRRGREHGIEVLLLLDEAEALIGIAEREGDDILKDLRREMQRSERCGW